MYKLPYLQEQDLYTLFFLPLQTDFVPDKPNALLLHMYLLILILAFPGLSFALPSPESSASDTPAAKEQSSISISSLITQSGTLVQEAISSNANASSFRIDATLYRESLRALMISSDKVDNEASATRTAPSKEMFMELVRMSALLQSAAACKTGRYIVCPIELRQQLLAQLKRLQALSNQTSTSKS